MTAKRLVLGTAQLGSPYGIANRTGKPDDDMARTIITTAWEGGIREFDTASVYGDSERVLGRVLKHLGVQADAMLITKLHPELDLLDRKAVSESLEASISDLQVETLHGLMLHREDFLDMWNAGIGKSIGHVVASGLVENIGVSVYTPRYAARACEIDEISLVQIPANIFDHRFEDHGIFELAEKSGTTLYIRSIFLQGLLLLPSERVPEHLGHAAPLLRRAHRLAETYDMDICDVCIGYIKHNFPESKLVFGAETEGQVKKNLTCWNATWPDGLTRRIKNEFSGISESLINPSLWNLRVA